MDWTVRLSIDGRGGIGVAALGEAEHGAEVVATLAGVGGPQGEVGGLERSFGIGDIGMVELAGGACPE